MTRAVIRRTLAENLIACTAHQGQDSEAAAFGRGFHSFAASYQLLCQQTREETRLSDVHGLATEAFYRARGVSPNRLQEFLELCELFAGTHPAELASLMSVEETLTHDIGWALLTCTLDRLDRVDAGDPDDDATEVQVKDWKTEHTLEGDHSFQIRWYVQMLFLARPRLQRVGFQIDLVRRRWQPEPLWFERGDLDEWWATTLAALQEAWEIQQAGRGVPTGGSACTFCAKRYSCGAAVSSAAVLPENDDQAAETISTWLRLQAAEEEHKRALRTYFGDRDPVLFNGLEVGFLRSRDPQPTAEEPQAVVDWMKQRGLEGEVALRESIDWNKVPKQFWPELVEAGAATIPDRPEFKARKAQLARQSKSAPAAEPSTPASPRRSDASDGKTADGGSTRDVAGVGSAAGETLPETIKRLQKQGRLPRGGFQ